MHDIMRRAWVHAQTTVSPSRRPSMSAGGAVGSFLAAIHRIGWKSLAYNGVLTLGGTVIDLSTTAPHTVMRYLLDDCSIVVGGEPQLFGKLNCGLAGIDSGYTSRPTSDASQFVHFQGQVVPWLEPIASVLRSK